MRLKLKLALRRADENGFTADIVKAFDQYGLPRQFFYLAVQESALDPRACGPETRYGFAKGMWQFIPPTAEAYKLRTGPLQLVRQFDPADERHDFKKSTEAAARYIRDIYQRDAEASGLLVMACYNWSETRVHGFVKSLPKEPKERNFWRLLEKFYSSIPSQTYEYIFLIFSAAVIGENPRLFGFDFDNPLAEVSELGTR